jgi:nicotinamide-nucleotide amidase
MTIDDLARKTVATLIDNGLTIATAESCTGGWVAKALVDISGASLCLGYGIVSYADEAKKKLLGVSADTLQEHGAVSEAVVREMVEGVRMLSGADIAVAVSGVAGPDGGTVDKPVGTVWIAWSVKGVIDAEIFHFAGFDRIGVREQTVIAALSGLLQRVG